MSIPSLAERARTSVAEARVATLTTYPRLGRPVLTMVSVRADDGAPVIAVDKRSAAAATLRLRPLGTVQLSPPDWEPVTLQGRFRSLVGDDAAQLLFRLDVGSVRVGQRLLEVVEVEDYWSCEPDPLRQDAPGILAHLRRGHGEQLAACLRANGHASARWAEPRRLDRYGLELGVLDDAGVSTARLSFTTPVNRVEDLSPGLSVVLHGGCGRCGDCAAELP